MCRINAKSTSIPGFGVTEIHGPLTRMFKVCSMRLEGSKCGMVDLCHCRSHVQYRATLDCIIDDMCICPHTITCHVGLHVELCEGRLHVELSEGAALAQNSKCIMFRSCVYICHHCVVLEYYIDVISSSFFVFQHWLKTITGMELSCVNTLYLIHYLNCFAKHSASIPRADLEGGAPGARPP